jgi:hypothetical protein
MVNAVAMIATAGPTQFSQAAIRNAFTPSAFVQLVPEQAVTTPGLLPLTAAAGDALLGMPIASATRGAAGKTLQMNARFVLTRRPGRNVVAILPGSDAKLEGQYIAIGAHSDHVGMRANGAVDHDSMRAFNTLVRPQGADSPNRPATAEEINDRWSPCNHQVTDEPEYLDFDHYRRATQLIHDVAVRIADLDHRPAVDTPKPDPNGACKQ